VVEKNISSSLFAMEGLAISGHSGIKLVYVNVNATDLKVLFPTHKFQFIEFGLIFIIE